MEINLKGRLAVVTGGSGKLGRVMCRTLGNCGASIAIHYLQNEKQARAVCKELTTLGVQSMAVQADITKKDSIESMKSKIKSELGIPDIIVNNAVIQYKWVPILDQDISDYESQFQSCVMQNVLMAKAFVPGMIKKRWGRIIAINTECAMQCFPTQSAYAAGKRGMDGVLRVLAKEIGKHQITVNQVAPGWTITKDSPAGFGLGERKYASSVPLKRRGHDYDIANLVAFLASDLAGFISGQYISVSGGNVMPAI
jgi:3-oxoacyl-[acyl-carrier protein] reductase